MSIARLHYVICNGCGTPASQPVDPKQARKNVPKGWVRTDWVPKPMSGIRPDHRDGAIAYDLCPTCADSKRVEVLKMKADY